MLSKEMMMGYDLVQNAPGMSDEFKLSISVRRKHLLLLCLVAEAGLGLPENSGMGANGMLPKQTIEELLSLIPELLVKGGPWLFDFYEKIKLLRADS
jgi:hypothetical protein